MFKLTKAHGGPSVKLAGLPDQLAYVALPSVLEVALQERDRCLMHVNFRVQHDVQALLGKHLEFFGSQTVHSLAQRTNDLLFAAGVEECFSVRNEAGHASGSLTVPAYGFQSRGT
jgi:hypothetical protein